MYSFIRTPYDMQKLKDGTTWVRVDILPKDVKEKAVLYKETFKCLFTCCNKWVEHIEQKLLNTLL